MMTAGELFTAIWPEGVPAAEMIVFNAVPARDQPEVLRRLEVAWRGECGEKWDALASKIDLKRAAFFNLRKSWRTHGIAGVIPNGSQRGRSVIAPDDDPLWTGATAMLRFQGGGARNVDIARSLLGHKLTSSGKDMAELQRIERLVQHARRALARDPEYLQEAYGSGLLIDLTAVSIVLADPDPTPAIVAVVVETASGLVLGSRVGHRDDASELQHAAIRIALQFLDEHRADRHRKKKSVALGLTLPPSRNKDDLQLEELHAAVRSLEFGMPGGFNYGQALTQLVGPRIGRMILAPRSTLAIDGAEYLRKRIAPVLELDQAISNWDREVLRHNQPILEVLKATGLVDGEGSPDAALARTLRAAAAALPIDRTDSV
jgi:hypothetical protein